MKPFAPWPHYDEDEIEAVTRVLRSGKVNYWTGEEARAFEREYAEAAGCRYAVALMNGTVALELALHALEVPPGSEVITTPRTFIASASAAVARGCTPVLADVDPNSGNITAETIERVLTPRTKAIIAVHLAGWPCDMDPIMELAERHGLKVIEDCAQASGATYKGRPVGSLGHAAAFSFCQDKIITTGGEGGMLTTNDERVWRRAWEYKDHGKSWEAVYNREHAPGFRWLHESFGTNGRMTELQAAIGRIQLRKLPAWTQIRRQNMNALLDALEDHPALRVPRPGPDFGHAAYKAYVYLRPERLRPGWTRDRIMVTLNERGIPCFSGSCSEIYREKAFVNAGLGPREPHPNARTLGETSLMFLVHPGLTPEDMGMVASECRHVLDEATQTPLTMAPTSPQPGLSFPDRFLKRTLDLVLALLLIALTFGIMLLAWLLATLSTGKNGLFTQTRIGRHGKPFKILKIRTMKDHPGLHTTATTAHDPRITPLGRWLRRLKIDELPQLFNVLMGQMSFVGPRPDVPGFADQLQGDDRILLSLRPGITGPATLAFRHEEELLAQQEDPDTYNREVIFPEKVRINKEYLQNYSILKDFRYILQTALPNLVPSKK